jgi:hypothetical protein
MGTTSRAQKSGASSRAPINVMQSTEHRLCDNLAVGLPRSNLKDCRITGRTLTKRSMRTGGTRGGVCLRLRKLARMYHHEFMLPAHHTGPDRKGCLLHVSFLTSKSPCKLMRRVSHSVSCGLRLGLHRSNPIFKIRRVDIDGTNKH